MRRAGWRSTIAATVWAIALGTGQARAQAPAGLDGYPLHVGGRMRSAAKPDDGTGNFPDAKPRYHNGATVVCADCHIMHASQTHTYADGAPGQNEQVPYASGANPRLLKAPDAVDLCISCHDGHTFAPDVVGADANGSVERSAGFFAEPEVANARGHDLGRGLSTDGSDLCYRCHFSSGDQKKVTCIDCHNPHGNNVARNLQWASWPEGTPDLGLFVNPVAVTMTARYEAGNVSYGTLNSYALREPSNMCLDCHHVFSGDYLLRPTLSDLAFPRLFDAVRGS